MLSELPERVMLADRLSDILQTMASNGTRLISIGKEPPDRNAEEVSN
jgi:hypothetical protein